MKRMLSSEVRKNFKAVLDDVHYNKQPVYITSHEREIGLIVPLKYAEIIEKLVKVEAEKAALKTLTNKGLS
jgi:PHD/YefM family antitoxin component YafN of YafNO toxin-antitoxin module